MNLLVLKSHLSHLRDRVTVLSYERIVIVIYCKLSVRFMKFFLLMTVPNHDFDIQTTQIGTDQNSLMYVPKSWSILRSDSIKIWAGLLGHTLVLY